MAVDKLVDSTQLGADLTSVADAIRTKGGTSAQLAFPNGFISAIQNLGGDGLTNDVKQALLQIGQKVAYIDDQGQQYYNELMAALYPVDSISAVFTQGAAAIYTTDSLDVLEQYLVVTANYSDGTSTTVTDYTLSGTLTAGTSTITVSYGGKTATFTVACTVNGWLYHFNQSLLSSGSEDFGFIGNEVYAPGRLGTDYCYSHMIPTSGDASSDTQKGIKAINLAKSPNLSGDFTISYWAATQVQGYQSALWLTKPIGTDSLSDMITDVTYTSPWTGAKNNTNQEYSGFGVQGSTSGLFIFRVTNADATIGNQIRMTIPNGFDTTAWHHYAFTKKGKTIRVFVDGTLICTAVLTVETIYDAKQIALTAIFDANNPTEIKGVSNGMKMQDLYIAEFCKWESGFDPASISY